MERFQRRRTALLRLSVKNEYLKRTRRAGEGAFIGQDTMCRMRGEAVTTQQFFSSSEVIIGGANLLPTASAECCTQLRSKDDFSKADIIYRTCTASVNQCCLFVGSSACVHFSLVEPDSMPPLHLVPDFAKIILKLLFGIYMMVTLIVSCCMFFTAKVAGYVTEGHGLPVQHNSTAKMLSLALLHPMHSTSCSLGFPQ